jgi:hypothetical protein
MSKANSLIMHSCGNAFLGANPLFEVINFQFEIGLDVITAALRGGDYTMPTRQPLKTTVTLGAWNLNVVSALTGGALSTGQSTAVVDETLTKSTNTVTLSNTPLDVDAIRITPIGSDKSPLIQVASSPAVGEYSISGTAVTLNASQSETQFKCEYLFNDTSNGERMVLAPDDLPSTFSYFGIVLAEDHFTGDKGHFVFEFAKVQRTGPITMGGSQDTPQTPQFEANIVNASEGDVRISYKAAS